jgi:hypothetical protein
VKKQIKENKGKPINRKREKREKRERKERKERKEGRELDIPILGHCLPALTLAVQKDFHIRSI